MSETNAKIMQTSFSSRNFSIEHNFFKRYVARGCPHCIKKKFSILCTKYLKNKIFQTLHDDLGEEYKSIF